jgi:hypothetical protein
VKKQMAMVSLMAMGVLLFGGAAQGADTRATCTIIGTAGNDTLNGTSGRDVICGFGGDDELLGYQGNDLLLGGSGQDGLFAGAGNDISKGGAGNDYLNDHLGTDVLSGGDGNEVCMYTKDSHSGDKVNGGAGTDHYTVDVGDSRSEVEKPIAVCPPFGPI